MSNHYVYKLIQPKTKEFYFGSRTCECNPNEDFLHEYFGSMKTWKVDKRKLTGYIIKEDFNNRKEAFKFENELIKKHIDKDLNRNYALQTGEFSTLGFVPVRNKDNKTFLVKKDDKKLLNGHLEHVTCKSLKGTVTVKDKNNNHFKVSVNDPRYKSGELVHMCTGYFAAKDKGGKMYHISKDDPRYKSGELVGATKNSKWSTEKRKKLSGSNHYKAKNLYQFSKNGNFIKKWNCMQTAAKELKIHQSSISFVCSGKYKTAGGYKWSFKKELKDVS